MNFVTQKDLRNPMRYQVVAVCLLLTVAFAYGAETTPAVAEIPAPRLLSPPDKMDMTDVASFFRWTPIETCDSYEIQIARDANFQDLVKRKITKNVRYHEDCYFPRDLLLPGRYCWRVRAILDGHDGPWSETFRLRVNADHSTAKAVVRTIAPARPVFLMRNRAWDPRAVPVENIHRILPKDLQGIIVPDDIWLWDATAAAIAKARKYDELGIDFVVWNNRGRAPLSLLEYFFQNFPHCIGTAEGEHFWGWHWERGPEGNFAEEDYLARAWVLCGKYGRLYFWGDGEASSYLWTAASYENRDAFHRYRANLIPMFKSTIGEVALHSSGAVEGLMAAGWVENSGMWADEFVWGECGFGGLGEINPQGKPEDNRCPWLYDIQMWLMGIASGSTAFHLESAHQWSDQATAAENYRRFFLPFVRAVVQREILPSRQAFLDSIHVAVQCDYERAKTRHQGRYEPDFAFLTSLYALKHTPFQEIIPDNSRYGIICLLPPTAACLNPKTKIVPQTELLTENNARQLFDRAYPARFQGNAFQWECDGTVIVTNSNENLDIDQQFSMDLPRGPVRSLRGVVGVHQYLLGKIDKDGKGFWFQTNCEYPARRLELEFRTSHEPRVSVTPSQARLAGTWDAAKKCYTLSLSVKDGAAECAIH
jgi:hypothetical protein